MEVGADWQLRRALELVKNAVTLNGGFQRQSASGDFDTCGECEFFKVNNTTNLTFICSLTPYPLVWNGNNTQL